MRLKNPERMRSEWDHLHPKLQLIICDLMWWGIVHGEDPTFTEFWRSDVEQMDLYNQERERLISLGENPDTSIIKKTSVHCVFRGADVRLFKTQDLNLGVSEYINSKYIYDMDRSNLKTLVTHEGSALHHHLQVYDPENISFEGNC